MERVTLTDLEGRRIEAVLAHEGEAWRVRTESGRTLSLPEDALVKQNNGDYYLLLRLSDLEASDSASASTGHAANAASSALEGETVIPLAEEQVVVRKRQVEGATVRVRKEVTEREEVVDEALRGEEVTVERVKMDKVVEKADAVRSEGDTTIIPLYEEVLVVEKRLVLVEEIRITKRQTEKRELERVTLRREQATVERLEPEEGVVEGNDGRRD